MIQLPCLYPSIGNCFTFNHAKDPVKYWAERGGSQTGLRMLLHGSILHLLFHLLL